MMPHKEVGTPHSDIAARLREQGYRLTPQRLTVIDVIARGGNHLTVDEIFVEVLAAHPFTNIATVYRTLQWLQQVGLVTPLLVGGEPIRYEFTPDVQHHHLICLNCGAERQIGDEVLDSLKAQLLARYGFAARLQHLGLPGYCAACRPDSDCTPQE